MAAAAPTAPAAAAAPEGEAALRSRLAEVEAKNAEALARVRELEENNFDLEAAMQVRHDTHTRRETVFVAKEMQELRDRCAFH